MLQHSGSRARCWMPVVLRVCVAKTLSDTIKHSRVGPEEPHMNYMNHTASRCSSKANHARAILMAILLVLIMCGTLNMPVVQTAQQDGQAALHLAANMGHADVVKSLLVAGASKDIVTNVSVLHRI